MADKHAQEIPVINARKICPVCGGPNGCCYGTDQECWCKNVRVSKEKIEAAFGKFNMDQTCLCPNCLDKFLVDE